MKDRSKKHRPAIHNTRRKIQAGPSQRDPSQTLNLRRSFSNEIDRRFSMLKGRLVQYILAQDGLGLSQRPIHNFNPNHDPQTGQFSSDGGAVGKIKSVLSKVGHYEHAAKAYVSDHIGRAVSKLPSKAQTVVKALSVGGKAALHGIFAIYTAAQHMAERVAHERGSSGEEARRLRGILSRIDLGTFEVFKAGTLMGIHAAHLPAAATGLIPVATAGYLAYSTARNPLKTARAAMKVVGNVAARGAHATVDWFKAGNQYSFEGNAEAGYEDIITNGVLTINGIPEPIDSLVRSLEAHNYDDWYIAILCAALDKVSNLSQAVALANHTYEEIPEVSEDLYSNTSDDDDMQAVFGTSDPSTLLGEPPTPVSTPPLSSEIEGTTDNATPSYQRVRDPFESWLRSQMADVGLTDNRLWSKHIQLAFQRGMEHSYDDVRRAPGVLIDNSISYQGGKNELLRSCLSDSLTANALDVLVQDALDNARNIMGNVATRLLFVLDRGTLEGATPREIAVGMTRQLGVSNTKAVCDARDAIIHCHCEGQLAALNAMGIRQVKLIPCPECGHIANVTMNLEDAHGVIPARSGCRCAWSPIIGKTLVKTPTTNDKINALTRTLAQSPIQFPTTDALRAFSRLDARLGLSDLVIHGGSGSGNFGHVGRPGEVGGSGEGSGADESHPVSCGADLDCATHALAQGKYIRLDQPEQVSTLLDKMDRMVQKAIALDQKAPTFDLCKVSVPGTNLFCHETIGIPRAQMPQLKGIPVPGTHADTLPKNKKGKVDISREFIDHLKEQGVKVKKEKIPASYLRASQNQIDGARVAQIVKEAKLGLRDLKEDRIFVTRDNYVLDGHHHWAGLVGLGYSKDKDLKVPVYKLNIDIGQGIREANKFSKAKGIAPKVIENLYAGLTAHGGPGSGNFGHGGRPGQVGGSAPAGGGSGIDHTTRTLLKRKGLSEKELSHIYRVNPETDAERPLREKSRVNIPKRIFLKYREKLYHMFGPGKMNVVADVETPAPSPSPAQAPLSSTKDLEIAHGQGEPSTEIGKKLTTGKVSSMTPIGGTTNAPQMITLDDGSKGIWKSKATEKEGLRDFVPAGEYYRREGAASQVAEIVGVRDLVPVTVIREINGQVGSLQSFVAGEDAAKVPTKDRFDGKKDAARAAAFDYLIANEDRHFGNWRVTPQSKLSLTDNGLSFPESHGELLEKGHLSILANGSFTKIPEEVKEWGGKWKEIKSALKSLGLSDEAIALTRIRLKRLVSGAKQGRTFLQIPHPFGPYRRGRVAPGLEVGPGMSGHPSEIQRQLQTTNEVPQANDTQIG